MLTACFCFSFSMAVHFACESGGVDALAVLIQHKVGLTSVRTSDGWTALHCAADKGNLEAIQLLLKNGVDVNSTSTIANIPICICIFSYSSMKSYVLYCLLDGI